MSFIIDISGALLTGNTVNENSSVTKPEPSVTLTDMTITPL